MTPLAQIFCACFLGILAACCVLAITGHWVFAGLMLVLAFVYLAMVGTGEGR